MAYLAGEAGDFGKAKISLSNVAQILPGLLLTIIIALLAFVISSRIGGASMLYALLFGMGGSQIAAGEKWQPGIKFAACTILKLGIVLLGVKITLEQIIQIGGLPIVSVSALVGLSVGGGFLIARALKLPTFHAVLTAGAVSICGASAAMAVRSVLPASKDNDCHLAMTIFGVTVLSTLAMIAYPYLAQAFGFDEAAAGAWLGLTIHNVAQAVGAGFIVSEDAAATATMFKLLRVACLAPVVVIIALMLRQVPKSKTENVKAPPILPGFLILFLIMIGLNSLGIFSAGMSELMVSGSEWALLISVAAIGMQTRLADVKKSGVLTLSVLTLQSLWLLAIGAALVLFLL